MNSKICITLFLINSISSLYAQDEIDLRPYEKRLISQNGEDGVIEKIFSLIGTTNRYFVKFGAGDGHYCSNTEYLRLKHGWRGLLMESDFPDDLSINLHNEYVYPSNVCQLFRKYRVPQEFDLISIDIDSYSRLNFVLHTPIDSWKREIDSFCQCLKFLQISLNHLFKVCPEDLNWIEIGWIRGKKQHLTTYFFY